MSDRPRHRYLPRVLFAGGAAIVAAFLLAEPAASQTGGCPKCVTNTICTLVNEGTMTGSCSVDRNGCTETLGICVVGDLGGHGTALKDGRSRKVLTNDGGVRLAAVGEKYFAAWDCTGEVRHLYKEDATGEMIPVRDRFALVRYRMPRHAMSAAKTHASS